MTGDPLGAETTPVDRTRLGSRLRALVAAEPPPAGVERADVGGWLHSLCAVAVFEVPATGAAVTLETEDGMRALAATSGPAYGALEEMQSTLGEGPSVQAFATRRPALGPDLSDRSVLGWPQFSLAAHEAGVAAAFAFPLQVGAARLGTFTLYGDTSGSLPEESLSVALSFADLALEALLDGQALAAHGATTLDRALEGGVVVYQAQGMLMVDLGTSLADALARLKAHAYSTDRSLSEVARDVVAGHLRLLP
jgi:hypothetical protein